MTKFKMFNSERWDDDIPTLEAAVNTWMEHERPVILDIVQSALGSHVLLSFLFEDEHEQDKRRATTEAAAIPEVFERTMEGSELDPGESREAPLPEAELPY